jgi:arylformamidase
MKLYRNFTTQEEIDLEYNLALTIPDTREWIRMYGPRSSEVRRRLRCELGVQFGPTLDETVDIFPAEKSGAPILVFIHGGYWFWGTSKDFSLIAAGPVARGFTVVVTNYSLCPKVTIAEITRQSRAVVAWLHHEAKKFNGDPSRIFVAGTCAGGQQAAMLVATDWESEYGLTRDIIKGGILISGVFDLRPLRYSYLQPKLLLTHEVILQQSPYLNIPDYGPPLLVTFGGIETQEFQRQSREFLEAWRARGLEGELLVQKGKHHFEAFDGFIDEHSELCRALVDFAIRCEGFACRK